MVGPYKLVVINIIAFVLFTLIVFFIRKIKHFHLSFVVLASLLPLISLLRRGVNESGDFAINISKSIDLYTSLSFGIFPVHWASLLNQTYGYPLFLFTYPLPYYSIVLFKFLGFSLITGEKIAIALVFILSGIGMYLLLRCFLKPKAALLGSILYLFAPYHLVDMHYRVALGEIFAYAFLTFVFYSILRIKKRVRLKYFLILCASYAGLILSHQAIVLVTSPFIFLLPLFIKARRKNIIHIYTGLGTAILLGCFYWLPVITSIQFTLQDSPLNAISFENPMLYILSPWRTGFLYQGPIGQLAFPIGLVQIGLLSASLYILYKKIPTKLHRTILMFLLIIIAVLSFLLLPVSGFLWKILPLMKNFQFAYRLMLPISFIAAVIGAIVGSYIKKDKLFYLLIFAVMGSTILNWGARTMLWDIDDANLTGRVSGATFEGEGLQPALPKWRDPIRMWVKSPPSYPLEITKGEGIISIINRTPIEHRYIASLRSDSSLVENTFYFPGWELYVNGKKYPFTYIDSNRSDLIRFELPKGRYALDLKFEQTMPVRISNAISLITLISLIIYFGVNLIPHRRK